MNVNVYVNVLGFCTCVNVYVVVYVCVNVYVNVYVNVLGFCTCVCMCMFMCMCI